MIVDEPKLGKLTFKVGTGDVIFSTALNPSTKIIDTFLITQAGEGAIGSMDEVDREDELPELGLESEVPQSRPADIALRFTNKKSLEQFVLTVASLLGEWGISEMAKELRDRKKGSKSWKDLENQFPNSKRKKRKGIRDRTKP